MDQIDKKIVFLLEKNARYPLKKIAEAVGLTSPAVSTRICRLEQSGILAGYHAQLSREKLGYEVMAFISLELTPGCEEEFQNKVRESEFVMECHNLTGQYGMLLKAVFRGTMELDTFIGEMQRFGKTSTQIVYSTLVEKCNVLPKLDEPLII